MLSLLSSKTDPWLTWFLRGFTFLTIIILFGRLIELQIIKGGYYRDLSEGNRIRKITISAPRGVIVSRGGETIVGNKEILKKVVFSSQSGYSKEPAASSNSTTDEVISEWQRNYFFGSALAHVSGYVGYVNKDEVGKVDPNCVFKGALWVDELVGRTGLEEKYNCLLSGTNGEELIEVDTSGKKVRLLGKKDAIAGTDIKTNINKDLQIEIARLMNGKTGSVVITDPNGEVLALFSSPSFDPNVFVSQQNTSKIEELLRDKQTPLFDRAISGLYHPGSVFKQVVATAALEEGAIDKDYTYEDTGQIVLKTLYGTYTYSNWYFTQSRGVEGKISLVRAITRSTDTFFYKVGELLGIDRLVNWAKKYGLAQRSGIDLPGDVAGLVPDPKWKLKTKGEQWFLGDTYNVSIGQGDLALTPILVNTITSVTASGGLLCQPRIVGQPKCTNLGIDKDYLDLIREGMKGVCSYGGTGYTFFDSDPKVGCKTGTAETSEKGISHAWFTFFAPFDNPEIVVTVFIEKGGEGSKVAGPIAREIFNYWFGQI